MQSKILYHVRHSCNHAAWWDNSALGLAASAFPCPWCGGESEHFKAPTDSIVDFGPYGTARKDPTHRMPTELAGETVIGQHMANEKCCNG